PFLIVIKRPAFIMVSNGPQVLSVIWKPLLRLLKSKIILDVRSTPVEKTGLRGRLLEMWFNISVLVAKKMFDGMTFLTRPMKTEVCDRFNIDSEFVGVWTSGVSTAIFDPEKYDGMDLRQKMGLVDKFIVLYHGSLDVRRGIIEVVRAMTTLKNEYDDIVLFFLGSGRAVPILRTIIEENGLRDRVIVHEQVRHMDVPKFIAMCDVGIVPLPDFPEWRHQNPIKLLEYLAMKKPVIITDIPAHREVVGDRECGIYVSAADPKEFAEAVTYAHGNISVLRECGSIGRAIVEKRYKREKVAEDLENFLLRLRKSSHSEKVRTSGSESVSKVKFPARNLSTSEKMIARLLALVKNLLYAMFYLVSSIAGRQEVSVLAYHSVGSNGSFYTVTLEQFQRHMEYLRRNYEIVSLRDIRDFVEKRKSLPHKCVALTFDDGYYDNYLNVYPYLRKYGLPAAIFVTVGYVHEHMPLDDIPLKMLGWREIVEMSRNNIDVGAHTVAHPDLCEISLEDARQEIVQSKEQIEKETGSSVDFFAYPRGSYSNEVVDLVRSSGFSCAFGSEGLIEPGDDPFVLSRVLIDGSVNLILFRARLTRAIRWYKEFERRMKMLLGKLPFMPLIDRIYRSPAYQYTVSKHTSCQRDV
nr:polysaccharide deacetylase family protein [Candidatus Njordarchaeum guaymaensis]